VCARTICAAPDVCLSKGGRVKGARTSGCFSKSEEKANRYTSQTEIAVTHRKQTAEVHLNRYTFKARSPRFHALLTAVRVPGRFPISWSRTNCSRSAHRKETMEERLQKIIARAGIASRRHAEEMITSGLVTVNGHTITELGSKADPSRDHIKVAGKLIRPEKARVYLILNKPPEVVSTMSDPEGRRSLRDLLQGVTERVFPVGRLEYHAYGLVFLTNDGDLANSILQSHRLPQTYQIKVKSLLTFAEIEELSRATGARISRRGGQSAPWYEVTIAEARRDALRDRLFRSGHPVEKMKRIALANLELGSLAPGQHRELSGGELADLRRAVKGRGDAKDGLHRADRSPEKVRVPSSRAETAGGRKRHSGHSSFARQGKKPGTSASTHRSEGQGRREKRPPRGSKRSGR